MFASAHRPQPIERSCDESVFAEGGLLLTSKSKETTETCGCESSADLMKEVWEFSAPSRVPSSPKYATGRSIQNEREILLADRKIRRAVLFSTLYLYCYQRSWSNVVNLARRGELWIVVL